MDGFLKSIGLDADQVGVEGKMPSIGASGKADFGRLLMLRGRIS